MVAQPGRDRNYIIPDFLAVKQPLAVQIPNVDHPLPEPDIGAAKLAFHSQRCFSHIEQDLDGKFCEKPEDAEAVFRHSQRHGDLRYKLCS
jgi:hypothetical protein